MPEPAGSGNFNEVLGFGFDTAGFTSGLNDLASIYKSWLSELNSQGIDGSKLFGVDTTKQFSEQLSGLNTILLALGGAMTELTTAMTGGFSELGDAAESAGKKMKLDPGQIAQNATLLDQIAQVYAESETKITQIAAQQVNLREAYRQEEAAKAITAARQVAEEQGITDEAQIANLEKLTLQRLALIDKQEEAQVRAATNAAKAQEKAAADIQAIEEKRDLEQATLLGKQFAAEEKQAAELVALEEKTVAERIAIQQKRDVETATILGKQFSQEEKEAAELIALEERTAAERVAIEQRRDVELAEIRGRQMAAAEKAAAEMKAIQEKRDYEMYVANATPESKIVAPRTAGSSEESGGLSGLLGGFGDTLVGVLKFQAAMVAINAAFAAATAPAKLFFETIKGGFDYNEKFQNRAQDLQAVLLDTVTYSSDMSKNIKLAGDDAEILVRQIDNLAIKLRTNADLLKVGFQDFLAAGGRNLTKNNEDALNVSGLVTSGLQVLTKNPALVNREEAQEMQKLISGTVKDGDKLTLVFGLAADKINEISKGARTTKDLFNELVANAPGLAERLKEAGDNEAVLKSTLELYIDRWEGLIAGPLFDQFIQILKQILDYIDKNSEQIKDMATQLGAMVGTAADFVKVFFQSNWSTLVSTFKTLANLALDIARPIINAAIQLASLVELTKGLKAGIDEGAELATALPKDRDAIRAKYASQYSNLRSPDEILTSADNQRKLLDSQINAGHDSIDKFGSGVYATNKYDPSNPFAGGDLTASSKGTGVMPEIQSDPSRGIITKSKTTSDYASKEEFSSELQGIKENIQSFTAANKTLLESAQESLGKYTSDTVAFLTQEKQAVAELTEQKAKKAENSGAKNADKEAFAIREAGRKEELELQKQIDAVSLTNTKDIENAKQITYKETATVAIQYAKNQLEAMKAAGASELEIAKKQADIDKQEFNAEMVSLYLQQIKAVNGTASERATIEGKINEAIAKRTGQISSENVAQDNALLHEQLAVFDQQVKSIGEQLDLVKQIANERGKDYATSHSLLLQQEDKLDLDAKELKAAQDILSVRQAQLKAVKSDPNSSTGERSKALEGVNAAQTIVDKANQQLAYDNPTTIGIIFQDASLKSLQDVLDDGFAGGVKDLTNAFSTFKSIVDDYNKGQKQGGLLGGIGGVLSGTGGKIINGVGDALGAADDAGKLGSSLSGVSDILSSASPFLAAIGPAFQIIGDLFTAAAKKTAEDMQKQFQQIQTNYSEGNINLSQAITQEQNTISETISKLSGEKGGQGELDAILPGMQQSLVALQQQQKQVFVNMDQAVNSLKLQQSYLQSAIASWQQINTQVTAYVNAGGSMQEAAEYISESLQAQKQQAALDLQAAESSAVQDAQNYNNLLVQRTNLIKQYNEQAFGIKNADSIERKQANAVTAASKLSDLTSNYQTSLQSDNQQITQLAARVSAEQQIFGIATDTASLQAESNSLALQSLQQQVIQWKSIQAVFNGIVQGSNGLYTYTQSLATLLGFTSTFGNDPASTYNGQNTIPGYTGSGTGTVGTTGVGTSAGGFGASPITNPLLPVAPGSYLTGASGTNYSQPTVTMGNISVTIVNQSGATIDATSIANSLQGAIINRNQYSGSTYYQ